MAVSETDNVATIEPVGRRARKALAVRQALFEAGLSSFDRQPIGLVSILDITEAADVAKGVFYLQFKSKDDYLLALWQEVQHRYLDTLREAVLGCRSLSARTAAAVHQFKQYVAESTAAARFWIRMAGYFPDEVGPPGHLARIIEEYNQQLASILSGKKSARLTSKDLNAAIFLDGICWAVINAEFHYQELLFDEKRIGAAVRTLITP